MAIAHRSAATAALVMHSPLALAKTPVEAIAGTTKAADTPSLLAQQLSTCGGGLVVGHRCSILEAAGKTEPRQPGHCSACRTPKPLARCMSACSGLASRQSGPACQHTRALASPIQGAPTTAICP